MNRRSLIITSDYRTPTQYKIALLLVVMIGQLCHPSAMASTWTVRLNTTADFDTGSTTALINTDAGQLQAPVATGGSTSKILSFGTGEDGTFNDGADPGVPQAAISVVGGTITFNTGIKSVFQFSSFTLSGAKTLAVTGSNTLTIRVRGPVTIAGTVNFDGAAGQANGSAGGTPHSGGAGRAGGGSGGASGTTTGVAPTAGSAGNVAGGLTTYSDGGAAGSNSVVNASYAGGGGGCTGTGPDAGLNSTDGYLNPGSGATCASTRTVIAANLETVMTGGGGGGGGGSFNDGVFPILGSGGGAGGGAIRFVALGAVTISGTVTAKGGNGGTINSSNGVVDSGAGGGGGSGGTVWIQTLDAVGGAGTIDISGGQGQPNTDVGSACNTTCEGGNGARGVLRLDTSDGTQTVGTITPVATANTNAVFTPASQTYVAISQAQDFRALAVKFSAPTETVGCGSEGTLSVVYQSSADGTNFDAGVSAANIDSLNGSNYVRVKVTIVSGAGSSSVNRPPCLTALSIPYETITPVRFELDQKAWGCSTVKSEADRGADSEESTNIARNTVTRVLLLLSWLLLFRILISLFKGRGRVPEAGKSPSSPQQSLS